MSQYYNETTDPFILIKRIKDLEQQLKDEREEHRDIYMKMKTNMEYYSSNNYINELDFYKRETEKLKKIVYENSYTDTM